MGQPIDIRSVEVVGDVAVIDTDRGMTGQDGVGFASAEAAAGPGFAPALAQRIFESDGEIDNVFIASSQVVVRRRGGWDQGKTDSAAGVVSRFFVFYDEAAG